MRQQAVLLAPLLALSVLVPTPSAPTASNPTASNVVLDGSARFEVLSPTLIRTEYAADGHFEDRSTFNVVNRNLPVPHFTTSASGGVRTIITDKLTLRYTENSGPFTPANLSVDLTAGSTAVTARPSWPSRSTCGYGNTCEAENLTLGGRATVANDHRNYTGTGFVAGLTGSPATISTTTVGVPAAGDYAVQFRYANSTGGDGQNTTRTMSVTAGTTTRQVSLPVTGNWDTWAIASVTMHLPAGSSPLSIACTPSDSCNVNVDSIAVTPVGAAYPSPQPTSSANLHGYRRALDGQGGPAMMADGLLSKDGWYLLDDSGTAILNQDGTTTPRSGHSGQSYQDGYFFGYGHDYKRGLADLRSVTGPATLLPRWAFGVWYSRYFPYTDADYRTSILPGFRSHQVPIDTLVTDTDWKSPNQWDGWEWNNSLFPDPQGFLNWTKQQGLQLALNIHPSIADADPKYAGVKAASGKDLAVGSCYSLPSCRYFDFADPKQTSAYFALHTPFEQQGVREWWLDQSGGESATAPSGVTPDSWLNAQYANRADSATQRGFAFSRIGGYGSDYGGFTPAPTGPWAEHRYSLAFTGDTSPTWDMLSFESYFTARESSGIGLPYISHDIGGFYADSANASNGHDNDDLYARWVQLGTFQPVLRLHSNHGDRLPWNYGSAAEASGEKFLRLRESLVPYTYTLAKQAQDTGTPIVRALYLNYPESPEAYTYDRQFLYGDDVLVAPVTTPGTGNVDTTVWFPPGTWTDYFTGKTYTGPSTAKITNDLSTMPVFLRSGGILPTRTDYVDNASASPLDKVTLDVAAGRAGSGSLYEDAGEGNGYRTGQSARTALSYVESSHTLTIGAPQGSYPGQVTSRTWTVRFRNVSAPSSVTVNGVRLSQSGWSYDSASRTLTVRTSSLPTGQRATISYQ